jgi:hypothetical protein
MAVYVPPILEARAAPAWRVHPRGTYEMRVRDALGPLFTDADFSLFLDSQLFSRPSRFVF